ncbi:MAG: hypothetical protein H7837_03505 [Magnetococcus sp. MYC-9]
MKLEEWLTVLGLAAVVVVVLFAILAGEGAPGGGSETWRAALLAQTAPALLSPTAPVATAAAPTAAQDQPPAVMQPAALARPTRAQPGMMPFEQAAQVRFSGQIQQISELQQQDGQIHLWLNDPLGQEQHLSVAPSWFLHYMGCTLLHDATISGTGFQFDKLNKNSLIYVKKLTIGKTVCHLRNDEGFALWSNQLR